MKAEYDFSKGKRGRFYCRDANLIIPSSDEKPEWAGVEGPLGEFVAALARASLNSYREQPILVTEHANQEHDTAHGGYAHRQLFELVQNSADALRDAPEGKSILIRLTERHLYCADDGEPIDEDGVRGLMFAHLSSKRGTGAIGRFGLGFKSVLGVTDAPEFFSRSGSFRFDKRSTKKRIAKVAKANHYPVLRLPEPINPHDARDDVELCELMTWATNIVRLPLRADAHADLARQIRDFPSEFVLLVDHVRYLTLEDEVHSREIQLQERNGEYRLDSGDGVSRWNRYDTTCHLSSKARSDWPLRDDASEVPIRWAVPLDRVDRPGLFWAYFPTSTTSLVAGILNAPWKTNEDRQNLLPGPYNEELIRAAASMIADRLPRLATRIDPARHLDALPRRHQAGDSAQSELLRECLYSSLVKGSVVPDQDGVLRAITQISYPPMVLTDLPDRTPCERWAEYSGRPRDWLHHSAFTRNRLATVDRLFQYVPECEYKDYVDSIDHRRPYWSYKHQQRKAVRAEVADWLEALLTGKGADGEIGASRAAVQIAATIPPETRKNKPLGKIVLTASSEWSALDPEHLFLPDESLVDEHSSGAEAFVHPEIVSDSETLSALKKLGIKAPSPQSTLSLIAESIANTLNPHDELFCRFWVLSRQVEIGTALRVISQYRDELRVRTLTGQWKAFHSVLLAGEIVPGDGTRDDEVTVDTKFHEPDDELLRKFGVTDRPRGARDLSTEPYFGDYLLKCRSTYCGRDDLPHNPDWSYLEFTSCRGVGPLSVLTVLSDEGGARYSHALMSLDACFTPITMWHTGTNRNAYPKMKFPSFAIHMLRTHGKIRTDAGIVRIAEALGQSPNSLEALRALLTHPKASSLKSVFRLTEPLPKFFGETDSVPLIDVWPGLEEQLGTHQKRCRLILCERILVLGQTRECLFRAPDIYLRGNIEDDEHHKLTLVAKALGLILSSDKVDEIIRRRTPNEVEGRRSEVRRQVTDPERLLAAVGERALRAKLPPSLLAVLDSDGSPLTGIDFAEAAIATWHTDALRGYRDALDHLNPPSRWAGSPRAVEFVQSLGFSPEWAGEPSRKRDPFLDVLGPYSLPELHQYQRTVAKNIRDMLRAKQENDAVRRGMVSLPTGSGKTRVAVQAIVESMRDDGFSGGVLWVADRDELCEQAVEAWRQVWSSEGIHGSTLRISRMWAGQPKPLPTSEQHVIVATIQTLKARLTGRRSEYRFLANFELVVFDEAHRSIAPTFTSVMQDIGLTRFQRAREPFLVGLTATPYRGHDQEETAWLVRRYGSKRLDAGAFEFDEPGAVVRFLQGFGVLAQADHETIEGETFSLADLLAHLPDSGDPSEELEKWLGLPWLPQNLENRIAQSVGRTKRILEAYEKHIRPDWPTLIFATSVEHAQTVAALLNRRGIRARAVSGETESSTRRHVVEEFRTGAVQALVNYGVFREGFDAPRTRAVVVARPVYSPNLYFQMIGRGLRGPRNGGSDRCLILNVRDNIQNFDRKLAFSDLNWLWADS